MLTRPQSLTSGLVPVRIVNAVASGHDVGSARGHEQVVRGTTPRSEGVISRRGRYVGHVTGHTRHRRMLEQGLNAAERIRVQTAKKAAPGEFG